MHRMQISCMLFQFLIFAIFIRWNWILMRFRCNCISVTSVTFLKFIQPSIVCGCGKSALRLNKNPMWMHAKTWRKRTNATSQIMLWCHQPSALFERIVFQLRMFTVVEQLAPCHKSTRLPIELCHLDVLSCPC